MCSRLHSCCYLFICLCLGNLTFAFIMPLRTPGSTRQTFSLTRYRRSRLCTRYLTRHHMLCTRYLTRHHMLPTIPLSLCGEKRGECTVVITSNARVVCAPHVRLCSRKDQEPHHKNFVPLPRHDARATYWCWKLRTKGVSQV